jgi:rhodanese-related sulfurtransferase
MKNIPRAFFTWQAIIAVAVGAALWLSFRGWQWDWVQSAIRRAHPALRQVPPVDLARWLAAPVGKRPVLFDVRTRAEFDYSHIPAARLVEPDSVPADLSLPPDKDTPIVLYCSTGQRSAPLAERIAAAGYARVWLLDGGIFRWANEDRILTGAHGPATTVHPQNDSVAHLLKRTRRAEDVAFVK